MEPYYSSLFSYFSLIFVHPQHYPDGFLQLYAAAALGLGLIALMTWADKRRPKELRYASPYNPVVLVWVFELQALVVLGEWYALLTLGAAFPLELDAQGVAICCAGM